MGKTEFPIGQRLIGGDAGSFIIAEIGINHDGSLSRAVQLIDAAAEAGADAAPAADRWRPDGAQAGR